MNGNNITATEMNGSKIKTTTMTISSGEIRANVTLARSIAAEGVQIPENIMFKNDDVHRIVIRNIPENKIRLLIDKYNEEIECDKDEFCHGDATARIEAYKNVIADLEELIEK